MQSQSVVFTAANTCELRQEDVADAGPGQILVQTRVSLISTGTESWCYRGQFDPGSNWAAWVKYPFYPGYSNVGRVVQVGDGVTRFAEGDRVFTLSAHRQYLKLPADNPGCIKLPEDVGDEEAAWCKLATITQTGVRQGEHSMGDTAVVVGAGPIGQLVMQYLRVLGLREIIAVDLAQPRLDAALAHAATQAFCGSAADAVDCVKEHTEGRLADVVYDVTGHYAVFPLALKLVRDHGTLVLLGDSPEPSKQHLTGDVLTRQLKVRGSHNERLPDAQAHWTFPKQAGLFLTYLQRGQMRVADLITHRFAPADAAHVYDDLARDRSPTLGVVFDWR